MARNYKFLFYLFGIFLLLQSCQIQIEDNRRVAILGKIVDTLGAPIPNISVRSEVYGEVLGEGTTDQSGNFEFVSLESTSYSALDILVNVRPYTYEYGELVFEPNFSFSAGEPQNENFSGIHYVNKESNRDRASYDLGRIQLNEFATLELFLNNLPGDENEVTYYLQYTNEVCAVDLNNPSNNQCLHADDFLTVLDSQTPNERVVIKSQLGTSVQFKYHFNNEPEQTLTIPLSNPTNTYVFEY